MSKIFWFFASPLHLSLFCAGYGLWRRSRRRGGATWIGAGLGFLALMTFPPLDAVLLQPLEDRFPPPDANMPAP